MDTDAGGDGATTTGGRADADANDTRGPAGAGGAPNAGAGGARGTAGASGSGGGSGLGGTQGMGGAGGIPTTALLSGTTRGNFGTLEVGVVSPTMTWTVANDGDLASSPPTLSNDNPGQVTVVANGCTAAIAGHGHCTITVSVRASTGGSVSGLLTLGAASGGTVTYTVTATEWYRLTVVKGGTGSGTVTSTPAGINCGTTCSFLINDMASIDLRAQTTNGSSSFFSGWSGGGCSGPDPLCLATVKGPTTVTATFSPMTNNLIFVTAKAFSTNEGRASAYDADCNAAATAAGINDVAGASYVAVTSDAASTVVSRLGQARGWVRRDGKPFADTQASLFTRNVVFNAVHFDETGKLAGSFTMSGAAADGTAMPTSNCLSFTSANSVDEMIGGVAVGGPIAWIQSVGSLCNGRLAITCMGKTKTAPVSPTVTAGRKIWVSNNPYVIGGAMTPDQVCQSSLPAGVTSAAAFIGLSTRAPSSLIDPARSYVRPDGTLVGTGMQLITNGQLESGIWQAANLTYAPSPFSNIWTGSTDPLQKSSRSGTCGDWTDPAPAESERGVYTLDAPGTWWNFSPDACAPPTLNGVYCVQTAP